MKPHFICLLIVQALVACTSNDVPVIPECYQVVPLPRVIEPLAKESFEVLNATSIVCDLADTDLRHLAKELSNEIYSETGKKLPVVSTAKGESYIHLALDRNLSIASSYRLHVEEDKVFLKGADHAGVFYGIRLIAKSLCADNTQALPAVDIYDYPEFAYRGGHLDVGRNFFPVSVIKRYIDILAMHNMNYFHWHLTDDQGWRIEMDKYPLLTSVGSHSVNHNAGYYTKDEIREVVAYAREKYITILPEVDMPGHMLSVLTAYPRLGCKDKQYLLAVEGGIYNDVLCVGKPESMQLAKDIIDELVELFPSEYIHIGGDEVPYNNWKDCPHCQQKITQEHITAQNNVSAECMLQYHFTREIVAYVQSKGRKAICWDEVNNSGLYDKDITLMAWRGIEQGLEAEIKGQKVIMTPYPFTYFSSKAYVGMETLYSFITKAPWSSSTYSPNIWGMECCIWTERIRSNSEVESKLLPSLAAFSELLWSNPASRDLDSFRKRLGNLSVCYREQGFNYAQ